MHQEKKTEVVYVDIYDLPIQFLQVNDEVEYYQDDKENKSKLMNA